MGTDDLFKKRREARKQRRHEYKSPKANSFLIITGAPSGFDPGTTVYKLVEKLKSYLEE